MLMIAKNGAFERLYPEIGGTDDDQDGFHCPPNSIATVPGDRGAPKINPNFPN